MKSLTHLESYKALHRHFMAMKDVHMRDLFKENGVRGIEYFLQIGDLKLDYSKNRITNDTLSLIHI